MHPSSLSSRRLRSPSSGQAGFTLIELIVTMVMLVTLAGVILPRVTGRTDDAYDARRKSDLIAVEQALNLYHLDNGAYPTSAAWSGEAPSHGSLGYDQDGYIPGLVPDYLPMLPSDPDPAFPAGNVGYVYRSDGSDFKFLAHRTPEEFPSDHRFYDEQRPDWAWQVSSPGAAGW